MSLTTAQKLALKTAINADPTFAAFPLSGDGYYNLAGALSVEATPVFWVWSTNAEVQLIRAAIAWANLTPSDAPDGTQTWANRSLQCQGKQFNLQMIIPVNGELNASDVNVRNGLQDALQNVRSGIAGAAQDAGWIAVRNVLARKATYIEKILSDAGVGNGSSRALAANLVFEGNCTDVMVFEARNS